VVADLCLPSHVSLSEIEERCYAISGTASYSWKEACKSADINSTSAGTILLLVLLLVLFISLIGSVGWYHWHLRNTGEPPILCPKFCPRALFPVPEEPQRSPEYLIMH
jgi:hypothetical protein